MRKSWKMFGDLPDHFPSFLFVIQTWITSYIRSTESSIRLHTFCLNSFNCGFRSLGAHCKMKAISSGITPNNCQQYKHARSYCWQWANFTMEMQNAKSTFCGVETKSMFIHTRSTAPKRFAKFVTQRWKRWLPNSSQTDYKMLCIRPCCAWVAASLYIWFNLIWFGLVRCILHSIWHIDKSYKGD